MGLAWLLAWLLAWWRLARGWGSRGGGSCGGARVVESWCGFTCALSFRWLHLKYNAHVLGLAMLGYRDTLLIRTPPP